MKTKRYELWSLSHDLLFEIKHEMLRIEKLIYFTELSNTERLEFLRRRLASYTKALSYAADANACLSVFDVENGEEKDVA